LPEKQWSEGFMKKLLILLFAVWRACPAPGSNIDLKESKFTQVVNDVQVISPADNSKHSAVVDALFKMPDVLRTGAASRAELVAEDHTITRVGANTIFSFDEANRAIDLKQGSLLFNSPKGKGGGSIHTAAATAAVLGTTIIVVTTPNGGFKVLTLEGTTDVRFKSGLRRTVGAGQLIFVLPGGIPGPVVAFRLDRQVGGSLLVKGFKEKLPSLSRIDAAIEKQIKLIASGKAQDTGLLVGDQATSTGVLVISPISQINGSLNPSAGFAGVTNNGLPPGFVVPTGLTFNGRGFVTPGGFTFSSPGGSNAPPITAAAAPAAATVGSANDVSITSSTLDPAVITAHVFTTPVDIQAPGNPFSGLSTFTGFASHNLAINSPSIDLSAFSGLSQFVFFADQTLTLASSLDLRSENSGFGGDIDFAAQSLVINNDVTLTADGPQLLLAAVNGITLSQNSITDNSGEVALESDASISLSGSGLTGSSVVVNAGGPLSVTGNSAIQGNSGVTLQSTGGMTLDDATVSANPSSGSVLLLNNSGSLQVQNGSAISAESIALDSPGGIILDKVTLTASSTGSSGQPNLLLSSAAAISLNQANLTGNNINILSSGGALSVTGNSGSINGGQSVTMESSGGMTVGVNVLANSPDGTITLRNDNSGELHLSSTLETPLLLSAGTIGLSSDGDILLDPGTTISGSSSVDLSGNGITIGTGSDINVNGTTGTLTLDDSLGNLTLNGVTLIGGTISIGTPDAISTDTSTDIQGDSSVTLTSGSGMSLSGNVSANLNGGTLTLQNNSGNLTLTGAKLTGGTVSLDSPGGISSDSASVVAGDSSVTLTSDNGMRLSGAINADPSAGTLTLQNNSGNLTLTGAQLIGGTVSLASPAGISTDSASTISGQSSVTLTSDNSITLGGNVSANATSGTITLQNIPQNPLQATFGDLTLGTGVQMTAGTVSLDSAGSILTDGGSAITANSSATLTAASGLSIGGNITASPTGGTVTLTTAAGPVAVNDGVQLAANNISVTSPGTLQTGSSTVIAGQSSVQLNSATGMTVSGSITANPTSGQITLANTAGLLTVNNGANANAQFTAGFITMNSPDGILINTPGQVTAGTMTLTAGSKITQQVEVANADLSGVSALNITARTVVLFDVALPNSGNTVLGCLNGIFAANPNTDQAVVDGDVNFIQNVTFHNALANTVGVGFTVVKN
jgi:hypothetical protein